jgi:hypothetical protein
MSFLSRLWSPWSEPMRKPAIVVQFPQYKTQDVDVTITFMGTGSAAEAKRMSDLCTNTTREVAEQLRTEHDIFYPWATISYQPYKDYEDRVRLSEKFTLFMKCVKPYEYNTMIEMFKNHPMPPDVVYSVAVKA